MQLLNWVPKTKMYSCSCEKQEYLEPIQHIEKHCSKLDSKRFNGNYLEQVRFWKALCNFWWEFISCYEKSEKDKIFFIESYSVYTTIISKIFFHVSCFLYASSVRCRFYSCSHQEKYEMMFITIFIKPNFAYFDFYWCLHARNFVVLSIACINYLQLKDHVSIKWVQNTCNWAITQHTQQSDNAKTILIDWIQNWFHPAYCDCWLLQCCRFSYISLPIFDFYMEGPRFSEIRVWC